MHADLLAHELMMNQERGLRDIRDCRMPVSRDPMDVARVLRVSPRERAARDLIALARWLAPALFANDRMGAGRAQLPTPRSRPVHFTTCPPSSALRRP